MAGNVKKKRKSARSSPPMTRAMLLPMSFALAQKISLKNHMALVALRQGLGNLDLAGELLKTIFLVSYLVDEQTLSIHGAVFASSESTLRALINCAASNGDWRLDDAQCPPIEAVLSLHDAQLAWLPTYLIDGAQRRLTRAFDCGSFPNLSLQTGL